MSKNTSKKEKKAEIKGFFGIDRSYFSGERGCEQIKNFRVDASGALITRPGRKKVFGFDKPITAAIDYTISTSERPYTDCLIATPPYLHAVSLVNGDDMVLSTNIGTEGYDVGLELYRRKPYIFDGSMIKTLSESLDSTELAQGYAPLYGKDWDPVTRGPINETMNQVCNHFRINYKVGAATSSLNFGFNVASVVRVEINGSYTTNYINEGYYLTGEFPAGSSVDVWASVLIHNGYLHGCRAAKTIGGGANERMIAFRNNIGTMMFCSSFVSDEALAASKKGFPNSNDLYFPEDLFIDFENLNVRAVCACGDAALIFSDRQTLLFKPNGFTYELYTLSPSVGCVAPGAVFAKGRSVYTFSSDGIYRFDVDLSEPYDTEIKKISGVLEGGEDFVIDSSCRVFENHADGELWFACPGNIFIYNLESGVFYSYTDLYSRAMINRPDSVYLFDWYDVWHFSDRYLYDEADGVTHAIDASAVSRWIDFGDITDEKKILTVHPIYEADPENGFSLSVMTDGGLEYSCELYGDNSPAPSQRKLRVSRCRFKCAKLKINCASGVRPKIYGAILSAQS